MLGQPDKTSDPKRVVVATDEAFAMPTAVTLRSLLLNGGGPFHITVIHDSLSLSVQNRILASLPPIDFQLDWRDASAFAAGATSVSHLSEAAYFRLILPDIIEADAGRVLYLDVDTIVRTDIDFLWHVDMEDTVVGAVQSVHFPFVGTRGAVNKWDELRLDPRTPFFNSGVLMIDIAAWKSEDITLKALEYVRSPYLGGGMDQEALNVATNGKWHQLEPIWNQQPPMLSDDWGAHLIFPRREVDQARFDPSIIHFQTRPKPWHRGCSHPWSYIWHGYAREVNFSHTSGLRQRTVVAEVGWRVKRAASVIVHGR